MHIHCTSFFKAWYDNLLINKFNTCTAINYGVT